MKEIIRKMISFVRTVLIKIRFGKKIKINGMVNVRFFANIKIKEGLLSLGDQVATYPGGKFSAVYGGKLTIGSRCFFNCNNLIVCRNSINIGEHCLFGPNVVIYDHDHCFGMNGIEEGYKVGSVEIGKNCWIGAGVTILRDTQIGDGCVIGAGTVVKGIIPPHTLVVGSRDNELIPIRERD